MVQALIPFSSAWLLLVLAEVTAQASALVLCPQFGHFETL